MKFSELNDDQKSQVLDTYRHINVGNGWDDYLLEQFEEELESIGISSPQIFYSGFCSQGDGLCFTGHIDLEVLLRHMKCISKFRNIRKVFDNYNCKVYQRGRYYHCGTMYFHFETDSMTEKQEQESYDMEIAVLEFLREKANQFYKSLDTEYYHQIEDEQVQETLEANDYNFDYKRGDELVIC